MTGHVYVVAMEAGTASRRWCSGWLRCCPAEPSDGAVPPLVAAADPPDPDVVACGVDGNTTPDSCRGIGLADDGYTITLSFFADAPVTDHCIRFGLEPLDGGE